MRGVRSDLKEMRDGTTKQILDLQNQKLDRTEANRIQAENMSVTSDHETRIRFIERYMWLAIGALTIVQFAAPYIKAAILRTP